MTKAKIIDALESFTEEQEIFISMYQPEYDNGSGNGTALFIQGVEARRNGVALLVHRQNEILHPTEKDRQAAASIESLKEAMKHALAGARLEPFLPPQTVATDGPLNGANPPYETEQQWMDRTRPECEAIFSVIVKRRRQGHAAQIVALNPIDAAQMGRNGKPPASIWGLPLVIDALVPLGVVRVQ